MDAWPHKDGALAERDGLENASAAEATRPCAVFRRLLPLLFLSGLAIIEAFAVSPAAQYATLTFFAAPHGGGDCEATPSSAPCRQASSDYAVYSGFSDGVGSIVSALIGVVVGACSDRIGRRPLLRLHAWLGLPPLAALALYMVGGQTLWIYLVVGPLARAFSIGGVVLACIADVVTEREDRAMAIGIFFAGGFMIVVSVLPLSGFLPPLALVGISAAAGSAKLAYLYGGFPETLPSCPAAAQPFRPAEALASPIDAVRLFVQNSFISRMALVMVFMTVAFTGVFSTLAPYNTGYLGFTRAGLSGLYAVLGASGATGLACVGLLVHRLGEVRALQVCLVSPIALPLLSACCGTQWQMMALNAAVGAPLCMLFPIVSGIKSNLVTESAQGLVQSALAASSTLASSASAMAFGFGYKEATHDGKAVSRDSVTPVFLAAAGVAAASWLLALSLPTTLPPPLTLLPRGAGHGAKEAFEEQLLRSNPREVVAAEEELLRGNAA